MLILRVYELGMITLHYSESSPLLGVSVQSCSVNLLLGMHGRAASAAGTKLSSSHLPQTGSVHSIWKTTNNKPFFCFGGATVILCAQENLHVNTGTYLGHIPGLPELFAKTQKIHTDLVTYEAKRQKTLVIPEV